MCTHLYFIILFIHYDNLVEKTVNSSLKILGIHTQICNTRRRNKLKQTTHGNKASISA